MSGGMIEIRGNEDIRRGDNVPPRVTEILQAMGEIDTRWFPKGAAERGSDVHLMTQLIDGELLTREDIEGSEYRNYLLAYYKFLDDWKPEMIEAELEVEYQNELSYIGHVDRIIELKGERYIIDYKTGGVNESHGLQLAAYRLAYRSQTDINLPVLILQLTKEGKYRLRNKLKYPLMDLHYEIRWVEILRNYYREVKRIEL